MATYAQYSDLPKLARVKLPNGQEYALVDYDGRLMHAPNWSNTSAYNVGDHVVYEGELYRAKSDISAPASGSTNPWDSTKWDLVTVDSEIKRLESIISQGIHFAGKTTSKLYDGSTVTPISINGNAYSQIPGDLVILDLAHSGIPDYAAAQAYSKNTYIKHDNAYYIANDDITSTQNTDWEHVSSKFDLITSDPEFIWDGSVWAGIGGIKGGLGDLAFKDTATGEYQKAVGVDVTQTLYAANTSKLVTDTITGINGTTSATYITASAASNFATKGSTKTFAIRDTNPTYYGTADVGTAVSVGTALSGTTTFNTNAISSAYLTGATTFNTNAISGAAVSGASTFTIEGVIVSVTSGSASTATDCLTFTSATTQGFSIETYAASTSTVGIGTTAAATSTVTLSTSSITPAIHCPSTGTTQVIYGTSGTDTVIGVAGEAQALTGLTYNTVNPASASNSAKTFATGSLAANASGSAIVTGLSTSASTSTFTVATTPSTITVK